MSATWTTTAEVVSPNALAMNTAVDAELTYTAFAQVRMALALTAVAILLFANMMWALAPPAISAIWLTAMLVVLFARIALSLAFARKAPAPHQLRRWRIGFFAGAICAGAAWAIGPLMTFPLVHDAEVTVLVVSLLCVSAVAMNALVAQQAAARAFICAILLPPAVMIWYTGGSVERMVSLVLLVGMVCIILVCRRTGQILRTQLETQFKLNATVDTARSAESRYFDLYNIAPVGYCTVNYAGRIIETNATANSLLGTAPGQLLGQSFSEMIFAEDHAQYQAHYQALLSTKERQACELRVAKTDGGHVWMHLAAAITQDESGRPAIRIVLSDATEQQQRAAKELKLSEARYRALVEWSPEPTVMHRDGKLLYVNPAFMKMIGAATAAELVGRSVLDFIHTADQKKVIARLQDMSEGATSAPLVELQALKTDGTPIFIEIQSVATTFDGVPASLITIRDITARKQADAQRHVLEAQLRESQKMQAIGTLAGGIAHDFNNILAAILGNTSLARQDVSDNPRALESLEEIHKAASRARDLVQQILSFSRRQPIEKKALALLPVIEESVRLLRSTLPARVMVTLSCAANLPVVQVDATQIQQVVINLATNASHAMPARPGKIDISLEAVEIDDILVGRCPKLKGMAAKYSGRAVKLAVQDNGDGMDADIRSRLFEPFFTTKPVNEGTGLGLAVVHGIVENHDGAISVDSVPGQGTTFTIYLPTT